MLVALVRVSVRFVLKAYLVLLALMLAIYALVRGLSPSPNCPTLIILTSSPLNTNTPPLEDIAASPSPTISLRRVILLSY
jgi:hypothetical protein